MRGSVFFLLVLLVLGGLVFFLALRDDEVSVVPIINQTASGANLLNNPCSLPGMPREACFWECDDIASACVQVPTAADGTACYECRDRRPARCEAPTLPEDDCLQTCTDTCTFQYMTQSRLRCATCDTPAACPTGTAAEQRCRTECEAGGNGDCSLVSGVGEKACYRCSPKQPVCAANQYTSLADCQQRCGGTCQSESNGCFFCQTCMAGTFATRTSCRAACGQECLAAEQMSADCWECPQSCADRCEARGYEETRDYQRVINDSLAKAACVSGVRVAVSRAAFGECQCTKTPQLTFDTVIPVCKATPCGDVACGEQKTCVGPEGELITAACRWQGWKNLEDFRYQAQIEVDLD